MSDNIKVLIVEDEAITAKCLQMDLEDMGLEVINPVSNGEDAIKVAQLEHPSLILMDIRLAGKMDGIETAEKILSNQKIPIIYLTGFSTGLIKERAQKTKPVGFVEKPINVNRIVQIINTMGH
ncbi:MAG TPA: response regulator [bacterium]|nr:response regulator [bacterium]HPN44698.1 response regulator [bacterium]